MRRQALELVQYWKDVIAAVGTERLQKLIKKKPAAAAAAAADAEAVQDPENEPFEADYPLTQFS